MVVTPPKPPSQLPPPPQLGEDTGEVLPPPPHMDKIRFFLFSAQISRGVGVGGGDAPPTVLGGSGTPGIQENSHWRLNFPPPPGHLFGTDSVVPGLKAKTSHSKVTNPPKFILFFLFNKKAPFLLLFGGGGEPGKPPTPPGMLR